MKGNKGADGERLPALPFVFREGNRIDPLTTLMPDMLPQVAAKKRRSPARAVLLPLVAVIAIAMVLAVVAAQLMGNEDEAGSGVPTSSGVAATVGEPGDGDESVVMAEAEATPTGGVAPAETATAPPSTATAIATATATTVPPTASATPSGLVRVRYVVGSGESCHSIRAKFGFAYEDAEDFFTAMGRLTGKSAASQCSFFPGDVVCVPAQADLLQIGALTRDAACVVGQ